MNYNLQQSFDDVEFKISKIKRSEKIKTMASLWNAVIDSIDLMTLFPRLVVFVMRDNDIASSFSLWAFAISDLAFQNWNNEGSKKSTSLLGPMAI